MAFTDEERRAWREEKRARERRAEPVQVAVPLAICLHCRNPFGIGDGVVTKDAALCDVCLGD